MTQLLHTISETLINPLEKAIAFEAVPTGKIKAKEHAKVAGSINPIGCIPIFWAIVENIGIKILAVTVLLQIFVTNLKFFGHLKNLE